MRKTVRHVVLGEESRANLKLFDVLRKAFGRDSVKRILELRHLQEHLREISSQPVVVCVDLFCYDLNAVTDEIGAVRERFPAAVFVLYVEQDEYIRRVAELPEAWASRLGHYFRLYREPDDMEYEPMVRASLATAQSEAVYNAGGDPIRLTPPAVKGLGGHESGTAHLGHTVFLSYARRDWDGFVQQLVDELMTGTHRLWLDRDFVLGGDDWMDAVGAALHDCDTLLLVLSPEAVTSKYVKMEYRYFFRQEKPIIPVLYRKIDTMPFELATLHYLDFSGEWKPEPLTQLRRILSRRHP